MSTRVQFRRGNTAQTAVFTGAVAEITVDTDKKTVVVHDGTTSGGFALALESAQLDQVAFTKANLAFDRANSAFAQANAAYDTANTKFNSTGGTISGNVIVTGNVTPTTDNVNSLGSVSKRWKDLFVGPGSINIDGIVIGNNGGQIVISGASDFVFQSTTGAPSVSSSVTANIALNAFNQANLAYAQANTSYGAFAQANLAYTQANSSYGVAVSAFAQANLAFTAANNAVDTWVRNQANAAYDAANSAVTTGQANVGAGIITVTSAYQANVGAGRIADVASGQANVGASVITLSNNITNVFNQANLAYTAANSAVTTGQANVGAGLITVTSAYQANVGAGLITVTSAYQANVGAGLITEIAARQANIGASVITLSNNITNVFNQANLAYTAANSAVTTGQANVGAARITDVASGQANVGAGLITVTSAYQANVGVELAARQANVGASVITLSNNITNVFNQANLAFNAANSAVTTGQANVGAGLITVTSAYQANAGAGIITANNNLKNYVDATFLPKTGGTISSDLTISGSLTVSGTFTTINTEEINLADNEIILNSNHTTNMMPTQNAGIIINRGNLANSPNVFIRYDEVNDYWVLRDNVGQFIIATTANVGSGLISTKSAYEANVGAAVISLTSAYQANVGAGLITEIAARQANIGASVITLSNNITNVFNQANLAYTAANSAVTTGQANVGAGLITVTSAYQANVGAGLITVTNNYQANVGQLRLDTGNANTSLAANIGAGRIADSAAAQANVGAGLIIVTSAYQANVGVEVAARQANVGASIITVSNNITNVFNQANLAYTAANTAVTTGQANVGAGLITVTSAYQANVGSAIGQGQANVGAAVISLTSAYQANAGAGLITVTNNYQANVGAVNIAKVNKAGDVMTGALSTSGALIGASLTSNTIATINTNAVYESTAVTTAAATQFTLDSFSTTTYRSAKYLVQISSGSAYELLEMTLIHDGTTVYLSQYGNIKTGATLAVFDASISTGTLSLLATPNNAVTTFKTAITVIPV